MISFGLRQRAARRGCPRDVRPNRARGRSERGETLVELIATVVLMGMCVVTVVGLIFTMVKVTGAHRSTTTANTWVHNIGESVISQAETPYQHCASTYGIATLPTGYDADVVRVERLDNPGAATPAWVAMGPGCVNDGGVQRVTIEAWSLDNPAQHEELQVVKRDTDCLLSAEDDC